MSSESLYVSAFVLVIVCIAQTASRCRQQIHGGLLSRAFRTASSTMWLKIAGIGNCFGVKPRFLHVSIRRSMSPREMLSDSVFPSPFVCPMYVLSSSA